MIWLDHNLHSHGDDVTGVAILSVTAHEALKHPEVYRTSWHLRALSCGSFHCLCMLQKIHHCACTIKSSSKLRPSSHKKPIVSCLGHGVMLSLLSHAKTIESHLDHWVSLRPFLPSLGWSVVVSLPTALVFMTFFIGFVVVMVIKCLTLVPMDFGDEASEQGLSRCVPRQSITSLYG